MHIGIELGLQKMASSQREDFLPQEKDYYLNESVKDYIKQQYSQIKTQERDLESQYVNENLRTLITTAEISNISVVDYLPNSIKGDTPADYMYYIFSRTKSDDEWFNNRRLELKGIKDYVESESNSPIFREFPLLIQGDELIVIGNATTDLTISDDIYLTYIKKPIKLNVISDPDVELDLPEHTHDEIVNLTVQKMLAVIGQTGQREE